MGFYDAFKDAVDIAQKADNIELYRKLLDLSGDALDLQNEVYKLSDENHTLRSEIERLKEINEIESDLELTPKGYYVKITEREDGKDIWYCPACWQNLRRLMPIVNTIGSAKQCCNCHTVIR